MPRWIPRPRPWTMRRSRRPAAAAASTYSFTTDATSLGGNAWRSSSCSIGIRSGSLAMAKSAAAINSCSKARAVDPRSFGGIFSFDDRLDAAPDREVADDGHATWLKRGDEVVEDLVGDLFVEDAFVAELDKVVLQRLQLDTRRVRYIRDSDL